MFSSIFFSASVRRFSCVNSFFCASPLASSCSIVAALVAFVVDSSFSNSFSRCIFSSNCFSSELTFSFISSSLFSRSIAMLLLLLTTSTVASYWFCTSCTCVISISFSSFSPSSSSSSAVMFFPLFASSTCCTNCPQVAVSSSMRACARCSSSTENSCSASHLRRYSSSLWWLDSRRVCNSFTCSCRRATTALASSEFPDAASWNTDSEDAICSTCFARSSVAFSLFSFAAIVSSSMFFSAVCSFFRSSYSLSSSAYFASSAASSLFFRSSTSASSLFLLSASVFASSRSVSSSVSIYLTTLLQLYLNDLSLQRRRLARP